MTRHLEAFWSDIAATRRFAEADELDQEPMIRQALGITPKGKPNLTALELQRLEAGAEALAAISAARRQAHT